MININLESGFNFVMSLFHRLNDQREAIDFFRSTQVCSIEIID